MILGIGEMRDKKRRKRILKLDREFNAKAMKQSRNRYRRQVADQYPARHCPHRRRAYEGRSPTAAKTVDFAPTVRAQVIQAVSGCKSPVRNSRPAGPGSRPAIPATPLLCYPPPIPLLTPTEPPAP